MINKAVDMVDRAGGWLLYQIDTNDYLAGALFGIALFAIPYLFGAIDIVFR